MFGGKVLLECGLHVLQRLGALEKPLGKGGGIAAASGQSAGGVLQRFPEFVGLLLKGAEAPGCGFFLIVRAAQTEYFLP